MGEVAIITPVVPSRSDDLRRYLATELPRDEPPSENGVTATRTSPFTGVLPPTHFARFVVIALDERPYLFFSSRFDGPAGEYLSELARTPQALTIFGHCHIATADGTLTVAELERHLCDRANWNAAPYVVSAIPDGVTVAEINRALSLRTQLGRFVTHAQRLEPAALAHAFRQLPAIRALLR